MLEVALTGGIATGKSTVAAMLRQLGAAIIDSDFLARKAVEPGSPALLRIRDEFGYRMLNEEGGLDRTALRLHVFGNADARDRLNSIVHPYVASMIATELTRIRAAGNHEIAVVDVPLLFEVGWNGKFDCVLLVYVPADVQMRRLMMRDNLDEQAAAQALAAQMPIGEKVSKAQFLVDNTGGLEETRKQVRTVWQELVSLARRQSQPGNNEPR